MFRGRRRARGAAFVEVARRHGDYAVCGVGVVVVGAAGTVVGAALVSVATAPVLVDLTGGSRRQHVDRGLVAARRWSHDTVDPDGDIHASADYRRHLAGVLTGAGASREARARASGGGMTEVDARCGCDGERRAVRGGRAGATAALGLPAPRPAA